jgi:LmbE family N-acetylglucosaminyl deacetylase
MKGSHVAPAGEATWPVDGVSFVDPVVEFHEPLLVVAPHMDDEGLACGGLIALLAQKARVHVVLATDGTKSPAPIILWLDEAPPDLGNTRMGESRAALDVLGVPPENVHFLGLPEARLQNHLPALQERLARLIAAVRPATILMPFRYDRHPDHLAVNHAVIRAQGQTASGPARLYEYFVYYRWRLLPGRDLRRYIHPRHLLAVDTRDVSGQKRKALDCYISQTTKFSPWQTRPILTPALLDEVSQTPELFLRHDPAVRGAAVFRKGVLWIRLVHRVEPFLKKWRYLTGAVLQRGVKRYGLRAG